MANGTKAAKGFSVTCPHCRDEDAVISIDVNDLQRVTCSSCDQTFSPRQARDLVAAELARWTRIVQWVEMAATMLAE